MALLWEMMRWLKSWGTCSWSPATPPSFRHSTCAIATSPMRLTQLYNFAFQWTPLPWCYMMGTGLDFWPSIWKKHQNGKYISKVLHQRTTTTYGNKPSSTWWTWTLTTRFGDSCQATTFLMHVDSQQSNSLPTRSKENGYGNHSKPHTTQETSPSTVASLPTSRTLAATWGPTRHLDTTSNRSFSCELPSWFPSMMQWWYGMFIWEEVPTQRHWMTESCKCVRDSWWTKDCTWDKMKSPLSWTSSKPAPWPPGWRLNSPSFGTPPTPRTSHFSLNGGNQMKMSGTTPWSWSNNIGFWWKCEAHTQTSPTCIFTSTTGKMAGWLTLRTGSPDITRSDIPSGAQCRWIQKFPLTRQFYQPLPVGPLPLPG